MSWLENEESNFQKNKNEIEMFHENLQVVVKICRRINQILSFNYLMSELSENNFQIAIRDSEDDRYRVDDDLQINSYKRILKIRHSSNLNYFELIREKTAWIKVNRYDDDYATWDKNSGVYPSILYTKTFTDHELKNISENTWIEVFGWLTEKTSFQNSIRFL